MLQADTTVTGRTLQDEDVCLSEVAKSDVWTLIAADAIAAKGGPHPIDATSCFPVSQPEELDRDQLIFAVVGKEMSEPDRIGVVLATGALYAALSGLPAPDPTSPSQAYGGWRLP
ncbi:MAG: hypothetical protein JO084_06470 [Bradyrhizobiaceae bacterium]|nr:hypothetical protein [Hyphomicrobiales bacterium]MBV9427347.1 hypothetical protein [Bradyrhizobiaceae bacterium]